MFLMYVLLTEQISLSDTKLHFVGIFDFSEGFKSPSFATEAGSMEAVHVQIYPHVILRVI